MCAMVCGHLLSLSCEALYGGVKHGVFSWLLNTTGLAQGIIKQAAPSFKAAFYYGASSGMARYVIRCVSFEAQKASKIDKYNILCMLNVLTIAAEILARYGTAYLLTTQAGIRIDMKYVHITAVLAAITAPCCEIPNYTQPIYINNNPHARREYEQQQREGLERLRQVLGLPHHQINDMLRDWPPIL